MTLENTIADSFAWKAIVCTKKIFFKGEGLKFWENGRRCEDKDEGSEPATLLKKRLWHRSFTVNFAKL